MTPEEAIALLDTPEAFRAWLHAYPPDGAVGEPIEPEKCPIACFLKFRLGPDSVAAQTISVDLDVIFAGEEWDACTRWPVPDWARRFIHETDCSFRDGERITASQALAVLAAVAP